MEESYRSSSMCKACGRSTDDQEESGWTAYFEDFSNNNKNDDDQQSLCNSSFDSPSLISDAATYNAWKNISHNKHVASPTSSIKKLCFKKTRAIDMISVDDSLEDTASSPLNSPKVSDLRPVDRTPRKAGIHLDNYQENEGHSEYYSGLQTEERSNNVDFKGKSGCVELKKRGLCLVPMSMLVKYIG